MKQKIIIGIDNEGELCEVELDKNDFNKDKYYYVSTSWYRELITETKGEEEARERLEDPDYWEEIGFLGENKNNFLTQFIDFKEVAEYVINNDGWQMTNGEFEEFATINKEEYYCGFSGCGQEIKELKECFVSKEELNYLTTLKNVDFKDIEGIKKLFAIFEKYKDQDKTKIGLKWLEVLN